MMKEFVFWQPTLSIHQSALLRSLATSFDTKVTLIVGEEMIQQRQELGWPKPDFGKTQIIISPSSEAQSELLSGDLSNQIHIFSGFRGSGLIVWKAFCQSLTLDGIIGIQSEGYKTSGFKGLLRLLRGRYDALRYRERIDFVLAIGNMGVNWFRRVGYSQDKVYPFGYFVETPVFCNGRTVQGAISENTVELVFVGRPLFNKGLDKLFFALRDINSLEWRLHVVGGSDDEGRFVKLGSKLGLDDRTCFHGILPNSQVLELISKCDLLILPSRWDGWGAVINEALMCGVPVVCSDKCGGADLLDGQERGEVFPINSIDALASILYRRISQGKKDNAKSERIRHWSKCISGESAANYFMDIINATLTGLDRPVPPWLKR